MGFFQDLFGQTAAEKDRQAGDVAAAGYRAGQAYAEPKYAQAATDLTKGYTQAQDAWAPIYNVGNAGANFYADITGANGPEGQARARATFQTDPGYQFAIGQGQQAIERQATKYGGGAQGGLDTALIDYTTGAASKQYGDWVNRVAPFLQYSLGGAQGLSGAYTGEGTGLATLGTDLAKLGYGTETGAAGAQAGALKAEGADLTAGAQYGANLGAKLLGYALAPFTGGTSALMASGFGPGSLFMGGGSPSGYGR